MKKEFCSCQSSIGNLSYLESIMKKYVILSMIVVFGFIHSYIQAADVFSDGKKVLDIVDLNTDTNAIWGNITGILSEQLDLTSTVSQANSALQSNDIGGSVQAFSTNLDALALNNGVNLTNFNDSAIFDITTFTNNGGVITKDNLTAGGIASGTDAWAEGKNTTSSGIASHSEGTNTLASGNSDHAEGEGTVASGGHGAHAEGKDTLASGEYSHAEGEGTQATNDAAHAEGFNTRAFGLYSHAEGNATTASGDFSHAEGGGAAPSTASGDYSHAEGRDTLASGDNSHAEGNAGVASGTSSHHEGIGSTASGQASHVEGRANLASGTNAHAEGFSTVASGNNSHAAGFNAEAQADRTYMWSSSDDPKTNSIAGSYNIHATGGVHITDGNVGIGTTDPDRLLESSGSGNQFIRVTSTNAGQTGVELFVPGAGNTDWRIINDGGSFFIKGSVDDFTNTITQLGVRIGGNQLLNSTTVDVSKITLRVMRSLNNNGEGVGIGFIHDTGNSNVGAAIIFERTGVNSQGKLHFATKSSTVAGADIPIGMTLDENGLALKMGAGTGRAQASGKANVQTTDVGTDANTIEKDLLTYSLPANSFSTDGKLVRITAWGSFAENGNTKTIRLKFGATIIRAIGPAGLNGLDWRIDGLVIRTGAATQEGMATEFLDVNAQDTTITAPTETLSGAVVIKITGQNGTASANDIVAKGMLVEYLN